MAEAKINVSVNLNLSNQEFRLVTLALAGKIKPDTKDARECLGLNLKLLEARAKQHADLASVFDGALRAAQDEASGWRRVKDGPDRPPENVPIVVRTRDGTELSAVRRASLFHWSRGSLNFADVTYWKPADEAPPVCVAEPECSA